MFEFRKGPEACSPFGSDVDKETRGAKELDSWIDHVPADSERIGLSESVLARVWSSPL